MGPWGVQKPATISGPQPQGTDENIPGIGSCVSTEMTQDGKGFLACCVTKVWGRGWQYRWWRILEVAA
jgi:hypothetical protein